MVLRRGPGTSLDAAVTGAGRQLGVKRTPPWRRRRFLIMAAVVVVALAYLIGAGIKNTAMYYLTVGELLSRAEASYDERLRLGGTVSADSVVSPRGGTTLGFFLTEGQHRVPVIYQGVVPDAFKPGGEVVVEGALGRDGVFRADVLLAKCPTKYTPF